MLRLQKAEYCLKNLSAQIAYECLTKGREVPDLTLNYIICNELLNPDMGYSDAWEKQRQSEEMERLMNRCTDTLASSSEAMYAALNIEALHYFDFVSGENIISSHETKLWERCAPLIKKIATATCHGEEDYIELYRKMVLAVILLSGLGDPGVRSVFEEARIALNSVFSPKEMNWFLGLPIPERSREIKKLFKLVAGIRLFNKRRGKSGDGIEDVQSLLEPAYETLLAIINKRSKKFEEITQKYTKLAEKCIAWKDFCCDQNRTVKVCVIDPPPHLKEQFQHISDTLFLNQVLLISHKSLINTLRKFQRIYEHNSVEFSEKVFSISMDIKYKIAVPSSVIYPKFEALSNRWVEFQNHVVLLNAINKLQKTADQLAQSVKEVNIDDESVQQKQPPTSTQAQADLIRLIMAEKERQIKENREFHINPDLVSGEVVYPDPDDPNIDLNGFCPVHVVETGLLLTGVPHIGGIKVHKRIYLFQNNMAGHLFGADPTMYLRRLLDYVRKNPQFIDPLNLRCEVQRIHRCGKLAPHTGLNMVTTTSKEVETETHPIPSYMDPKYIHSTWQLKAVGVKLANILNYRTHSTQGNKSHWRAMTGAQTQNVKSTGADTKQDSGTNVPTQSRYMYNLWGDSKANYVSMICTRPVSEGPFKIRPSFGGQVQPPGFNVANFVAKQLDVNVQPLTRYSKQKDDSFL